MVRLIILILLVSNISFAQNSVYLNQNDKAPFDGYLLPEDTVKSLRNDSLELGMYKSVNALQGQQVTLLTNQNANLTSTLEKTSSLSTWEKIGYFLGGVIVTSLAIDGASKLIK